jgi:hypothetical protein
MCACLQKRNGEIDKELNIEYYREWSIRLGFKGEITEEFFKKYESVKKARNNIRNEILIAITVSGGFSLILMWIQKHNNDLYGYLNIPLILFLGISIFSIIAHVKVVRECVISDRKHINEYQEWFKEKYENKECIE